jgi:ketosteroid isomerase-like protein
MNEQQNARLVQQAYEAFGRGDIQGVLSTLSEQVEWRTPKPEGVPFGGEYRGRDDVARFFSELNQYEEVTRFEPREFIAQGEKVVALGTYACNIRSTGRKVESEWVHVFTIREGKVVKFQEHFDTAKAVNAYRTTTPAYSAPVSA